MQYFYNIFNDQEEEYDTNRTTKFKLDGVVYPDHYKEPPAFTEKGCDMAMVYKAKNYDVKMETFLTNLRVVGLEIRQETGVVFSEYHAALISAPDKVLTHFSKVYGYELTKDNPNWVWLESNTCCKAWRTELTHPTSIDGELMKRAKASVTRLRPTNFTHMERVMIVNKIMVNNQYSDDDGRVHYGYESMKKTVDVYALHESTWRWSRSGQIKDRQLLYRFWANLRCLLKVQPTFMIEKYFSTETAFYFVYMGFYNRMLMPLALAGLVAFAFGILEMLAFGELEEFCDLDLPICPICQNFNICPVNSLKEYCKSKAFALLFDNGATVLFAVFSSIWSVVFLILWRRKQATMALRWNVRRMQFDETLRPEFIEHATEMKISRFTQKQTIDIPFCLKVRGYVVSYISIILLITCSVSLIILTAFYRHLVHALKSYIPEISELMISFSSAYIYYTLVSLILIPLINKLSATLTRLECHRTQQGYDCSVIYKECLLSLPSFYGVMIYLSLFKGKFFVFPTDATRWTVAGAIPADSCNPAGCMIDVTVQFIVIMTSDAIIALFNSVKAMYLDYFFKLHKLKYWKRISLFPQAPRWEKDFLKIPTPRTVHVSYYKELMISYGLITWFAAICPLGPLLALMRHLVELRLHAFRFLIVKRRVTGLKVASIGCWNNIMTMITLVGIISNGIMITFSSTMIHRIIYFFMNNWTLKGYVRKSFTSFDTRKFSKMSGVVLPKDGEIADICYYRGYQIDIDNKDKYVETNFYWLHLVVQVVFLLIYENWIFITAGIVFLLVPLIPHDVRLKYRDEEEEIRDKRIEILNERFYKQNRRQSPH